MKIFCLGKGRTGTTSLSRVIQEMGFVSVPRFEAESLIEDAGRRDFSRVIELCRGYDFFRDDPFNWPFAYAALDAAFPGSRFILTIRPAEEWYSSLLRLHMKIAGKNTPPTEGELKAATYHSPGWLWTAMKLLTGFHNGNPYDKLTLITHYQEHNRSVQEYFRNRPDDLLLLDVTDPSAHERLCVFLGRPPASKPFPWLNRIKPPPCGDAR